MRKLMWFTIGYAIACGLGTYLVRGGGVLIAGVVCIPAMMAAWHFREHPAVKRGMTLALGCAVGALAFIGYEWFVLRPIAALDHQVVPLSIRVTDYSWETSYGCAADGVAEVNGREYRLRFYLNDRRNLSPGDRVEMDAKIRLTDEGGSREPTFHRTRGILLLAYCRGEPTVTEGEISLRGMPAYWARRLKLIIGGCFAADTSGFAKALLLGDKSDITWAQSTVFSRSGISHIVAVSGLHISILFAFVSMITGRRRFLLAIIGIPVLLVFGTMAGFTASVTRAVIMQILLLLALVLNREYDPPTALSFSCLVMLMQCPLTIAGIGFQLSVASVAGIFLFYANLDGWLKNWLPSNGKTFRGRMERFFTSSVAVTLSSTVMTVPLTAIHFGLVSLVGVVTNLLVIPVVSIVFYGVMAVGALGCIHAGVASALAWVVAWPIRYVLKMADVLAELPLAAVYTVSPYVVAWLIFAYALLIWLLITRKKRPGLVFGLGVLGLCISLLLSFLEPLTCDYRVTVLDVGQGQCIVLQSEGTTFLVDCGGDCDKDAADIASHFMLSQGIRHIDGLILTHYDRDHAGGVPYLCQGVDVDRVYLPNTEDTDGYMQPVLDAAKKKVYVDSELNIAFGDAQIRLFPAADAGSGNDSCVSVLFQRGECDTLITGDLSAAAERQLLEKYEFPDLEVLIVGHHGSKYSTCEELLAATAPDVAVISVGAENSYGHPTDEVLERLKKAGCAIYRTDLHGTITYRG